ncbi:MAG: hypothetical protein OIN89_02555 [Candidatus Methanoperedens sp.]|jgi:hypothetical protein|nr:hypothetical protein [Candidatus Methanoperedens sp.]
MSVGEDRDLEDYKIGSGKSNRALFLVLIVLSALFASVGVAEAAGTPTKLIVFTDKKVYIGWSMGGGQQAAKPPTTTLLNTYPAQDLRISVYALVLDDDGMPMSGRTVTATIADEAHLDHYNKNDNTVHHVVDSSISSFFNIGPVTLTESGGIYSSQVDIPDIDITTNLSLADDHIYVNVTVTDSVLGTHNLTVLVSGVRCHNSYESAHSGTHFGDGAGGQDNCGVCHAGNEHWYENISGTIPYEQQDVHFKKMPSFEFYGVGKDFSDFEWNLSYRPDAVRESANWGVYWPGSQYCGACHLNRIGTTNYNYDYGVDRADLNDKPSCGFASTYSFSGGPASSKNDATTYQTIGCHATTEMQNTAIPLWSPGAASSTEYWNNNINSGKSHNISGNSPNVSCATCHLTVHGLTLPNKTVSTNVNDQCNYCHTSDGPSTAPHTTSTTDCTVCHKSDVGVLDAHIPTASSGGVNCASCHDISGTAGADIDITNTDSSAHANLNNLSQYTTGNASNRKCWACHGNSSNSYANETNQPDGHYSTYKTPRTCPDCHDNTDPNSNFNAPQAVEHTQGAPTVPTTDIKCSICHNNSLTSITESDGFGLSIGGDSKNASVSHYLTTSSLMTSSDCRWCHITNNLSADWGTPFDPRNGTNYAHTEDNVALNANCYNCHGGLTASVKLHDTGITAGGSGGQDCVNCHDGTTGSKVNVDNMNNSDSIHLNLNTGGTANGRAENKICYACHTNDSYIAGGVVNNNSIPTSDHPTGYLTPKNCTLCHINTNSNTNFSAPQVSEHYMSGTELQTRNYANLNDSCIGCHIENEMLQPYSDDTGTSYSNISHYGKSRNNTALVAGDVVNCKYCHDNGSSTTFDFVDTTNRTISNHSANSLTTPECTLCHNEGRMHDGNLTSPALDETLCTGCHTTRDNHSGLVSCLSCHVNSSASRDKVHPINYITTSGTFAAANTTAVNCEDCHQGSGIAGFENAPRVAQPVNHSTDANSGQKWGNYWLSDNASCEYCHGDTRHNITALGNPASFQGSNVIGSDLTGTWCLGCHLNGSANYNNMLDNLSLAPPEITAGDTNYPVSGTPKDHTGLTMVTDNDCTVCHAGDTTNITTYMHDLEVGQEGGRDCVSCHDIGKSTAKVDVSKMNTSTSIHTNLNSLATASITDNKRCWACHSNSSVSGDGQVDESELPDSGHPDGYDTPKNCTLCHVDNNFGALIVGEHFTGGTDIKTKSYGNTNDSCVNCHNKTEMLLSNSDPAGTKSIYASVSHYGDNKTGVSPYNTGSTSNCTYCHNNSGTAFSTEMVDSGSNTSITNHTNLGTNPGCTNSTCHNSGRIHFTTLSKPTVSTALCTNCHDTKSRHNDSIECSSCHLETNLSIHGIQYLQPDTSWGLNSPGNKSSAVNCTDCHQGTGITGFNAVMIPDPMKHSSNLSNGSIWGTYWNTTTESSSSCVYCHNDTRHNATGLGKINSLLTDGNNSKNGNLATTTWCIDCHYSGAQNYLGSMWTPNPPKIDTNNTGKTNWEDHNSYLSAGVKDSNCQSCHALNVSSGAYTATSLNYSHSLDEGVAGGPNCIECHSLEAGLVGASSGINFTAMNLSAHFGMNSANATARGYVPAVGACWACHQSNGNVTSGHPDRKTAPKTCTECHLGTGTFNASAYNAMIVSEHYYGGNDIKAGNSSSSIASCLNCHENVSEMITLNNDNDYGSFTGDGIRLNGGNMSAYHYGKPRTDLRVGSGSRESNCLYCHQNLSTAFAIAMEKPGISMYIYNHTDNPGQRCASCHGSNNRLHNNSLSIPNSGIVDNDYCQTCHGLGVAGTRAIPDTHNSFTMNCWNCHQDPNETMYQTPVHGMMYAQTNGSYQRFIKGSPANCTTCHVYNLVNTSTNYATLIPELNHSTDSYAGQKWGSYWNNTSMITACYYCHQTEPHNINSALIGNVSTYIQGLNTYNNPDISTSTWCANCHYAGAANYGGNNLVPVPPEITDSSLTSSDGTPFENHSTYFPGGYTDDTCKECHSPVGNYEETTRNFSHSLNEGGGGPDCVSSGCHGLTGSATSPYMNWTSLKSGMHAALNSGADTTGMTDPIVAACWACHGDGTKPSGHPTNYQQPYYCKECHLASGNITGKYPAKNVSEHQHIDAKVLTNSNYARCEDCHNNSLAAYSDNETNALFNYTLGNVSHYGANKTAGKLMESTVNSTNCVYCHLNNSNRQKWSNATNATATKPDIHSNYNAATSSSECWGCHVDGGVSSVNAGFTLHDDSLNPGASEFCMNCHTQGGSAQNVNVSSNDLGLHVNLNTSAGTGILNNSDCWSCHFGYPNGISGTHSYDVSRQNTYYCEDCHGPVKNGTAQSRGYASSGHALADFYHGKTIADYFAGNPPKYKDCTICHLANDSRTDINGNRLKIYHNQTPLGKVANTGWDGWTVGMVPGCNDCHQTRNLNDGPFHAPGKDHYVASSGGCSYNCHDMLAAIPVHEQISFGDELSKKYIGVTPPEIRSISVNSPVVEGANVNITAFGLDNYLQIATGQYRVVNSTGAEVAGWTTMTPQNNKFKSRAETSLGTIVTTGFTAGNYTVYVRVMASGPKADLTKRAYPLNGAWSGTYSTKFTVKP